MGNHNDINRIEYKVNMIGVRNYYVRSCHKAFSYEAYLTFDKKNCNGGELINKHVLFKCITHTDSTITKNQSWESLLLTDKSSSMLKKMQEMKINEESLYNDFDKERRSKENLINVLNAGGNNKGVYVNDFLSDYIDRNAILYPIPFCMKMFNILPRCDYQVVSWNECVKIDYQKDRMKESCTLPVGDFVCCVVFVFSV